FPDTKTSILFMLLDARFLLLTASGAYEVLSKTTELENLKKKCKANAEKVLLADSELYAAINCIMGMDQEAGLELHSIKEANPVRAVITQETIAGARSRLRKKSPESHDMSRGAAQLNEEVGRSINLKNGNPAIRAVGAKTFLSSSEVQRVGLLGLKNNKQTVTAIYHMVKHDHSDISFTIREQRVDKSNPSPEQQDLFTSGVRCSKAISHYIRGFVEDISKRKSYRLVGDSELNSVAAMHASLTERITFFEEMGYPQRRRKRFASSLSAYSAETFGNLVLNVCVNLACGDVYRVLGKDPGTRHVNYRVLGLFISLFCALPPILMHDARATLVGCFAEYGKNLPTQIDDILCVLTDLKNFSYTASYTAHTASHNDEKSTTHFNANTKVYIEILTTLARLFARSAYYDKTNMWEKKNSNDACAPIPQLEKKTGGVCARRVEWLDIIKALLCECTNMVDVSLAIDRGGSVKWDKRQWLEAGDGRCLEQVRSKIFKVIHGKKLRTIRDFLDNEVKIFTKIDKYKKKIGQLLKKRFVAEKGTKTKVQHPRVGAVKALHDIVWDTHANSTLPSKKIDRQLATYLLCRSYMSASHALDIMKNYGPVFEKADSMPLLDDVLKDYFWCYATKSPACANTALESNNCGMVDAFALRATTANIVRAGSSPVGLGKTVVDRVCSALEADIGAVSVNGGHVSGLGVEKEGVSNRLSDIDIARGQEVSQRRYSRKDHNEGNVSVVNVSGVTENQNFTIRLLFHNHAGKQTHAPIVR
ncbi:MAG: hypothetical protein AB8U44_04225, partial [Aaplasma endosymbiont of Hyalomma asiaticum]